VAGPDAASVGGEARDHGTAEPRPGVAPPVGFARVVGFAAATAHLAPTDRDQLIRRITKAFEAVCHRADAAIYSAGDCDFVMFTDHLTHAHFAALGDELASTMRDVTAGFEPPLELVIGHGGAKQAGAVVAAGTTSMSGGHAEIFFY
jgi:class 3 adenylate cyclase